MCRTLNLYTGPDLYSRRDVVDTDQRVGTDQGPGIDLSSTNVLTFATTSAWNSPTLSLRTSLILEVRSSGRLSCLEPHRITELVSWKDQCVQQ